MISSKNIRFHAPSNTYIIPKNSVIDENVAVSGNLIAGPGTHFWKNIKVDGNVQLGKGCILEGDLKAGQVIVGSGSRVKGNINAESDVSLFQNAVVRSLESGGNITIMPGCVVGYANGSTLQVIGKAEIKKIGVITKVTVRANTVAEMEEEKTEDEEGIKDGIEEEIKEEAEKGIEENSELFEISEISEKSSLEKTFENNLIDEIETTSEEQIQTENKIGSDTNSDSLCTPEFPVETSAKSDSIDAEKIENFSEGFDAEIIDETDESSPKTFSLSEFSSPVADRPVSVPTDESAEVEIVAEDESGSNDSNESNGEFLQTVETPFGTVVVGEKSSRSKTPASSAFSNHSSSNHSSPENSDLNQSDQFASVTAVSKEEQQADFEAEMKTKSKPKYNWPAFEPRKMPKTEQKESANPSKAAAWPTDASLNQMKVSAVAFQFEEVRIQSSSQSSRKKTDLSAPEKTNKDTDVFRKANQQIVFEEYGQNTSVKPQMQTNPAKTEIKAEKIIFSVSASENKFENKPDTVESKPEKKFRSQEEIEKSKIWYEERHPQTKSQKKEYPPYV
ncbi:hypothetical protein MmiAt1_10360 [Methanimicrococcus sp. At1]|uniref:Polymer-forming cytoskeletal protein n=1 Tax=Methanimicrococcus hacksteinii TaxID=3028293 RepID=A0ABU3VPX1_9EURY|nr:polymer-forming cytoskeletal protein [Methanimicrococcus sp. At1]MDV0445457.1 hypothetical protein [Methanimicrococcus sp. At1]